MALNGWTDEQLIDAWMEFMRLNQNRAPRTLEAYRLAMERLQEFVKETVGRGSIKDVDHQQLELFCGLWLHKKGVVARSRKPYISAVRGFYQWCLERGHIERSAAEALGHPRTGKPLPNVISLANAERLMNAPDLGTFKGIRDSAILHLLVGCGLRVSGLCRLNEGDLHRDTLAGKTRLYLRVLEKGDKERVLPLPREAEAILLVYLGHEDLAEIDRNTLDRRGNPDKVLFVSTRNSTVSEDAYRGEERRLSRQAVHDLVQTYGTPLGIPIKHLHPHAMRHLYGTELTEGDVPTVSVSDLMGHADPKSTAIYVALSVRKKTRLVDEHGPLAKLSTPVSQLLKRLPS
ncbi:tyrosine-type recombinase/integrase [Acidovorax sp. sif1233]|uniref:tyrosine-type recombinase/integrase n=1 Tax=Acidovorax sp. sif1233 TaxID=2854792 RepID=UPI001C48E453|nr:tyrosine-type recombinase/integrase [Acidovorax sp. sif1233]MBV7454344.1 tyrosine-type recombinase/integrase [Acidovorax sp. sif1233]